MEDSLLSDSDAYIRFYSEVWNIQIFKLYFCDKTISSPGKASFISFQTSLNIMQQRQYIPGHIFVIYVTKNSSSEQLPYKLWHTYIHLPIFVSAYSRDI